MGAGLVISLFARGDFSKPRFGRNGLDRVFYFLGVF
jgi:hypothetical protein